MDPNIKAVGQFQYWKNPYDKWVVNVPTLDDYYIVSSELHAKKLATMFHEVFKLGQKNRSQEIKDLLASHLVTE